MAKEAIKQIAKLYKIEKHIHDNLTYKDEIFAYWQKFSEPIVDAFFIWLYDQQKQSEILPSNQLSKAHSYTLERKLNLRSS